MLLATLRTICTCSKVPLTSCGNGDRSYSSRLKTSGTATWAGMPDSLISVVPANGLAIFCSSGIQYPGNGSHHVVTGMVLVLMATAKPLGDVASDHAKCL
ncbi:hypothetical protein OK016_01080 [Vibrio chagasii]|nr:hypothetical protein [Vibrio chagasii]